MNPIRCTLFAIIAFVALAVGSFVYFIANWDASKTKAVGAMNVAPAQTAVHLTITKYKLVGNKGPVLPYPTEGDVT